MCRLVRFLALIVAPLAAAPAQGAPPATAPNLVVLISVDQMRADYLDQYGGQWSKGLKTLLSRGAVFRNARYPYLNTITCAGHSTIGTGAFPHRHGMVLNAWWDPAQRKPVECTADPAAPAIFYGAARGISVRAQRPQHPGPHAGRDPAAGDEALAPGGLVRGQGAIGHRSGRQERRPGGLVRGRRRLGHVARLRVRQVAAGRTGAGQAGPREADRPPLGSGAARRPLPVRRRRRGRARCRALVDQPLSPPAASAPPCDTAARDPAAAAGRLGAQPDDRRGAAGACGRGAGRDGAGAGDGDRLPGAGPVQPGHRRPFLRAAQPRGAGHPGAAGPAAGPAAPAAGSQGGAWPLRAGADLGPRGRRPSPSS